MLGRIGKWLANLACQMIPQSLPLKLVPVRPPSEISIDWVYFPPFAVTVALGYLCAVAVSALLKSTGLDRFVWHPGLAFLAYWVLSTSLIGLVLIPP